MHTYDDHAQPLLNLTNRVMAVVDDSTHADAVLKALAAAGIHPAHLAALSGDRGIHWIDAEGAHGGRLTRFVRGFQRWNVEGAHLRRYEAELANGRYVIDIHAHPLLLGDWIEVILRTHGAHFINAYGQWTISPLAA